MLLAAARRMRHVFNFPARHIWFEKFEILDEQRTAKIRKLLVLVSFLLPILHGNSSTVTVENLSSVAFVIGHFLWQNKKYHPSEGISKPYRKNDKTIRRYYKAANQTNNKVNIDSNIKTMINPIQYLRNAWDDTNSTWCKFSIVVFYTFIWFQIVSSIQNLVFTSSVFGWRMLLLRQWYCWCTDYTLHETD